MRCANCQKNLNLAEESIEIDGVQYCSKGCTPDVLRKLDNLDRSGFSDLNIGCFGQFLITMISFTGFGYGAFIVWTVYTNKEYTYNQALIIAVALIQMLFFTGLLIKNARNRKSVY